MDSQVCNCLMCGGDGNFRPEVEAQTQKAKGFLALHGYNNDLAIPPAPGMVVLRARDLKSAWGRMRSDYPINQIMVRGCPERPRHGFVDSVPVQTLGEAARIYAACRREDPKAELILSPFIGAERNFIWTPGSLGVGDGHDGATAGRNAFAVPLCGVTPANMRALLKESGVGDDQWPYIEIVEGRLPTASGSATQYWLTQVRAGMPIAGVGDYIPRTGRVTTVVEGTEERPLIDIPLLEWERMVAGFEPGTAVYHPGGIRTDHITQHAATSGFPVLYSRRPVVGEMLQANDEDAKPFGVQAALDGLVTGAQTELRWKEERRGGMSLVLLSLHHATAQKGEASFNLGAGASLMLRMGTAALLGELRHNRSGRRTRLSRDTIYNRVLTAGGYLNARGKLLKAFDGFLHGQWGQGFGGRAWADCTDAIITLDDTAREFVRTPDDATLAKMVLALNRAVNKAHNNGWWMNKFVPTEWMDQVESGEFTPLLPGVQMARTLHGTEPDPSTDLTKKWGRKHALGAKRDAIRDGERLGSKKDSQPKWGMVENVPLLYVQGKALEDGQLHIQVKWKGMPSKLAYLRLDLPTSLSYEELNEMLSQDPQVKTLSGTDTMYARLGKAVFKTATGQLLVNVYSLSSESGPIATFNADLLIKPGEPANDYQGPCYVWGGEDSGDDPLDDYAKWLASHTLALGSEVE